MVGEVLEPLRARYAAWLGMDDAQVLRDRDEDPTQVRAIQILLRLERDGAPSRAAALASAAAGCAALCLDERSAADGEWFEAVHAYCQGHIRKVTRRGRGAQWAAAAAVPGLTIAHGETEDTAGTEVRVLVPGLVGELDRRVAKLQVGGTDLPADEQAPIVCAPPPERGEEPGPDTGAEAPTATAPGPTPGHPTAAEHPGAAAGHAATPGHAGAATPLLTVLVPADLEMTAGKLMAQTGHAGMLTAALLAGGDARALATLVAWRDAGCPSRAVTVDGPRWAHLLTQVAHPQHAWEEHRLLPVRDAGFTEVAPGTVTVIGRLETLENSAHPAAGADPVRAAGRSVP